VFRENLAHLNHNKYREEGPSFLIQKKTVTPAKASIRPAPWRRRFNTANVQRNIARSMHGRASFHNLVDGPRSVLLVCFVRAEACSDPPR